MCIDNNKVHKMIKVNKKKYLPLMMAADSDTEPPSRKGSASDRGHAKYHHPRRDTQGNMGGTWLA